jgi:hypothetical protein
MTDPTPDFRALCWELVNELHGYKVAHPMHCRALLNRARSALATPPPEPTPLKLKRSGGYQPLAHSGKTNPPPQNP